MNEAETRAEYIDPKLKASGWGEVDGSKVLRERNVCKITDGRILSRGERAKPEIAEKLPVLLNIKYHAIANAEKSLGDVDEIRSIFFEFQKNLYAKRVKEREMEKI